MTPVKPSVWLVTLDAISPVPGVSDMVVSPEAVGGADEVPRSVRRGGAGDNAHAGRSAFK